MPRPSLAIPYDGHTLASVIARTERLTGCEVERAYVDKGYRGHNTANPRRVFISGQKRGVFVPSSASYGVDPPSKPSSAT
jgi:hypothetical protein